MKQQGLILIEKRGESDALTFRWIAPLNIPATCNFFYEPCQWESLMIVRFSQKKLKRGQGEYF